jgi:hypothetical protein
MAGQFALADSTTDIVDALVSKGVLTEEEGKLISKGATSKAKADEKAMKSKINISNAIENATIYGDIRVRGESRKAVGIFGANGIIGKEDLTRGRYKVAFGIETKSGDWYTDLSLAGGATGRSDNLNFATSATAYNTKQNLLVRTAMIGWKATDWLTLEAGRTKNPFYTTPMVWDADYTVEGIVEKANFKLGNADIFLNAAQMEYLGVNTTQVNANVSASSGTNEMYGFQGGAKYNFTEKTSGKAALSYYTYGHNNRSLGANNLQAGFVPGLNTTSYGLTIGTLTANNSQAIATSFNPFGINDLDVLEIPAEINMMAFDNVGVRLYGDYAQNLNADDRANNACRLVGGTGAYCNGAGNDDKAMLIGFVVGSASDLKQFESNKLKKGDWQARLWYQEVGVWALDPNLVDSDFMDSRVNMKGVVFKGQYNIQDNVFANIAYGTGSRKNNAYGTAGSSDLASGNIDNLEILQLDLTYKF